MNGSQVSATVTWARKNAVVACTNIHMLIIAGGL